MRPIKSLLCIVLTLVLTACGSRTSPQASSSVSIATPSLLFTMSVPINGRSAVYMKENISVPEAGELYAQSEKGDWHQLSDSDNLKYLILQDTALAPTLWSFMYFEDPPYTYGEVLETIYNVHGAEDIVSITISPTKDDNTLEGLQRQEEVGIRILDDRDTIAAFYDIVKTVECLGEDTQTGAGIGRFQDGSITYDRRRLTVTLADGTTIDSWKYDAQWGAFYESGGIRTQPLSDEDADVLRTLLGIS